LKRSVSCAALALAACALAWCSGALASIGAGNLASVGAESLPALPENGPLIGLVAIEGKPVAIQAPSAWVLNTDRKTWTKAAWREPARAALIRGTTGDGRQAFLLLAGAVQTSEVAHVARLTLDGTTLALRELPALPVALKNALLTPSTATLYIGGLDPSGAPRLLELSSATPDRWIQHAGWPGTGTPISLVAQNSALYLAIDNGAATRIFRWSQDQGWQDKGNAPGALVPNSGRAIGQAHILYLVRDAGGGAHPATFHTIAEAWAPLPYRYQSGILATAAWNNGIVSAREAAGAITFEAAQLQTGKRLLGWADWTVIAVYLATMVGVGVYFQIRDKQRSAAEFFVGSRSIPFWAAGVSLYATNTSSISYVAIPAKSFETNWTYLSNNLVTVLGLMFVGMFVVPMLRRLDLVSVFSYLEMRFHPAIRVLASALCILMQVGSRMSVVLFLPALAIATITGIDVVWSVLIMGVSTIFYTTIGGMKAVIWTDFLQVIVMIGGAIFAIGFVVYSLGGHAVYETAVVNHKMKLVDFSFDFTQASIWGFVLLMLLDVVLTFPKDQVLMQRALATKSGSSAGRSIWIFALITIPGGFMFYGIGTALFAYYKAHPERLDPLLPIDATFPLFIAAELPVGVTGLIIAGIFAAAMSTLSGTINSVATLLAVDFYGRVRKPSQEQSLRFAEWMSVVIGVIGILLALTLSRYDVHSLLDTSIELAGLLGGGFAGAYTLGMFTRRANSPGVSIGVASAVVVTLAAWWFDLVHPYFYLGISIAVCIVVGYCASLFFPAPTRSLAGLTIQGAARGD
jgi:SSS family solute:Na+ symporter